MKIKVGMKCKQIKAIEEYGFNYIGQEFKIVVVNDKVIKCEFLSGYGRGEFGIDPNKFEDYFELVEEKNNINNKGNEVYTCQLLPCETEWKITNKNQATHQKIKLEDFSAKVIINNNATIVILNDGSKGIARCMPSDTYDFQRGLDIACSRALIKSYQKKLKELVK